MIAALDRLESELGEGEYLIGDRFTVADLTAAALFYPLVMPPEGPLQMDPPPALADVRRSLEDRRGYQWVNQIFARHRQGGGSRERAGARAGTGATPEPQARLSPK